MVNRIHNIQQMNQKQSETWKQNGSLSVKSRQTIQVLKEKETAEKKEGKGIKKKVVDTLCESNINTVVEEHFSPENTKKFCYCCQSTMIKCYRLFSNHRTS